MAAANPQANTQYETNKLPGFKERPFDGVPRHYFDLVWFIPFIVACGNIQQDGWTLHQTYFGNDLGGVNNPGGNAAQQAQHRLRVHRLYNVLMNHIVPDTRLYRTLCTAAWVSEGIRACDLVRRKGTLPLSEDDVEELTDLWSKLNVESLKLDIDRNTLYNLLEAIEKLATKFDPPKTRLEVYSKFLQACPHQLSSLVAGERMAPNATFVYPAMVDNEHPLFVAAGLVPAGGGPPDPNLQPAHPMAGQKDSDLLCDSFSKAWSSMISSGAVREKKAEKKERIAKVDKFAKKKPGNGSKPKPKREVDEKTCCYRCGGLGHVAKMLMDDGSTVECATAVTISPEILNKIIYPHIPTALERRTAYKAKKEVKEVAEEATEEPTVEEPNSSDEEGQYANMLHEVEE